RAMRRELETGLRRLLTGHEGGNLGHSQGAAYGLPRQLPTLPRAASPPPSTPRLRRAAAAPCRLHVAVCGCDKTSYVCLGRRITTLNSRSVFGFPKHASALAAISIVLARNGPRENRELCATRPPARTAFGWAVCSA